MEIWDRFHLVEFKSPMSISHILFVYKTFLDKTDARRFELLVLKRTPRLKPGTLNHSVTHPLKTELVNMYIYIYNYRHGTRTHNGRNQCFYRAPPLPVRNICIMKYYTSTMTRTRFLESSVLRFSHISYQGLWWRQSDLNWHQLSCKDTIITNYTISP